MGTVFAARADARAALAPATDDDHDSSNAPFDSVFQLQITHRGECLEGYRRLLGSPSGIDIVGAAPVRAIGLFSRGRHSKPGPKGEMS